jgi:hypothetical protein
VLPLLSRTPTASTKSTVCRRLLALICVEGPRKGVKLMDFCIGSSSSTHAWSGRPVVEGQGGAPAALARTNDLDADAVNRMLFGGATRICWCFTSCAASGGARCCCCGACRRPDLSGCADKVRRHDEDGVPGARAGEGAAAQSFRDVHRGYGWRQCELGS